MFIHWSIFPFSNRFHEYAGCFYGYVLKRKLKKIYICLKVYISQTLSNIKPLILSPVTDVIPYVAGLILVSSSGYLIEVTLSWAKVFSLITLVNATGLGIFLIFGDARRVDLEHYSEVTVIWLWASTSYNIRFLRLGNLLNSILKLRKMQTTGYHYVLGKLYSNCWDENKKWRWLTLIFRVELKPWTVLT